MRVALLAARLLSNDEIGRRLSLPSGTVVSCLYRIYGRLGVTSRARLAAVLTDRPDRDRDRPDRDRPDRDRV